MDALYIEKVCKELNSNFKKKKITGISYKEKEFKLSIERKTLTFILKNPNGILIKEEKVEPDNFFKKFKGTYIKNVSQLNNDRVIDFEIIKLSLSGKKETFHIITELTGKNANVFITTETKKILFKAREALTGERETEIGKIYEPPPNTKKPLKELKLGKVTPEGVEKNLYKYVRGLSPLNSKEIAFYMRKGLSLEEAYKKFISNHEQSEHPYIYYKNQKPKFLTTFKYESIKELDYQKIEGDTPFTTGWSIFTEKLYTSNQLETLKSTILKEVVKQIDSLKEKLKNLEKPEDLEKESEKFAIWGELLKYNLQKIKPGMKKLKLNDYTTGKSIEIKIDPSKTPKENMEKFFSLSQKLKRKSKHIQSERETLKEKIEFLSTIKELAESTNSIKILETLKKELFPEKKIEKQKKSKAEKFLKFKLPSGKEIIVGKNSTENEILSLKLSNPWDLWFHTKEIPGSHVILKLNKNEKPNDEDIELAAAAAAYFSKGRNSGKVKVDFTKVKNLKKPPKTPTGFVIYSGEKTVLIDSEIFKKYINDLKL